MDTTHDCQTTRTYRNRETIGKSQLIIINEMKRVNNNNNMNYVHDSEYYHERERQKEIHTSFLNIIYFSYNIKIIITDSRSEQKDLNFERELNNKENIIIIIIYQIIFYLRRYNN